MRVNRSVIRGPPLANYGTRQDGMGGIGSIELDAGLMFGKRTVKLSERASRAPKYWSGDLFSWRGKMPEISLTKA